LVVFCTKNDSANASRYIHSLIQHSQALNTDYLTNDAANLNRRT
jgi:hypothetical protein